MPTDRQEFKHFCVPNALRDAWTYETRTKRPSRIAVTRLEEGLDHVQAMGQLPDGSWIYLTTHNVSGDIVMSWEKHYPAEPYRFLSLDEFIDEQKKVRKEGMEP